MNALRRIVRALQSSARRRHHAAGPSGAQLFVLRQLADEGAMSLTELAGRTLSQPSTLSEAVGRLERAGLVRRRPSRLDTRRVEITPTPAGSRLSASAPPSVPQRLADGLSALSVRQRAALAASLEAWTSAAGLARTPAAMLPEPNARG